MNADKEKDFQERLSLGLLEKHLAYPGSEFDQLFDYDSTIARLAGVDALSPVCTQYSLHSVQLNM